jgi:hypothetical protein
MQGKGGKRSKRTAAAEEAAAASAEEAAPARSPAGAATAPSTDPRTPTDTVPLISQTASGAVPGVDVAGEAPASFAAAWSTAMRVASPSQQDSGSAGSESARAEESSESAAAGADATRRSTEERTENWELLLRGAEAEAMARVEAMATISEKTHAEGAPNQEKSSRFVKGAGMLVPGKLGLCSCTNCDGLQCRQRIELLVIDEAQAARCRQAMCRDCLYAATLADAHAASALAGAPAAAADAGDVMKGDIWGYVFGAADTLQVRKEPVGDAH